MQNLIIPRECLNDLSVKAAILYGIYLQRAEDESFVNLSQGEISDILHITKKTAGKYQHELLDAGYIQGCSMTGSILNATVKKPEGRGYAVYNGVPPESIKKMLKPGMTEDTITAILYYESKKRAGATGNRL